MNLGLIRRWKNSRIFNLFGIDILFQHYECQFNRSNVDIAALLFFSWYAERALVSLNSGISQVPYIVPWRSEEYQHLSDFFEDKDRPGKDQVDGTVYTHAALECIRNMANPNDEWTWSVWCLPFGMSLVNINGHSMSDGPSPMTAN